MYDKIICSYQTLDAFKCDSINESLLIVHVNIVSLDKNFDNLILFLNQISKPVDIICLSETRLNDLNLGNCNITGYTLYHRNSKTKAGGSAIFVSERLKCQEMSQTKIKSKGCEDAWVEIVFIKNTSLIVGSVYRHPTSDVIHFKNVLVSILKKFKAGQNYAVLGDININYNKIKDSPTIANYANHINRVGCVQLIDKPTRITANSSSIIDHIYTNSALVNGITPTIISEDISDHTPICAEVKCKYSVKASSHPLVRRLSRKSIELFLKNLGNILSCSKKAIEDL